LLTKITFYGEIHEIGGNKFLVEDRGTRIFLDFGMQMGKCGISTTPVFVTAWEIWLNSCYYLSLKDYTGKTIQSIWVLMQGKIQNSIQFMKVGLVP
jgi:hypothetical protein